MLAALVENLLAILILFVRLPIAYLRGFYRLLVWPDRVPISGKVVLITGGGSGLGREIALRMAAEGARLVLWDVNENGNKATAGQIRSQYPDSEVHLYTVDVTNKNLVKSTAQQVSHDVGQVYMLVNNAGVLVGETLLDITEQEIERTININLLSHFWTLRAFLPQMLESNSGHIVTTCSTSSLSGMHRLADYCASKFGVMGLDESLEYELRDVYKKTGIKLTLVCPHTLDTGLIHSVSQRFEEMSRVGEAADAIVDQILRQFRYVFFPKHYRLGPTFKGNLTHEGRLVLMDFINVQLKSQKANRPHRD